MTPPEQSLVAWLASVVAAYDAIAADRGWAVVDATGTPAEVADAVWAAVAAAVTP